MNAFFSLIVIGAVFTSTDPVGASDANFAGEPKDASDQAEPGLAMSASIATPDIMAGEPAWITLTFKNPTEKGRVLRLNGDFRNRLAHPIDQPSESLIVKAVDERGQKVARPEAQPAMSGVVTSDHRVPAKGQTAIELFLPHWTTITAPGQYRFTIRCRGKLFPDTGAEFYLERPDTGELTAEMTLRVVPADAGRFGALIEQWGPKLLGGSSSEARTEVDRARRMLAALHDERVVPWYVKLLDQPRNDSKFHACDGLAPYGSEAAFAALKQAMKTTGADLSETADGKLAEGSADQIRYAAALALAKNPHADARAFLLTQANDRYDAVRGTVLDVAAKLNTKDSRAVIERLTKDGNQRIRDDALRHQKEAKEQSERKTMGRPTLMKGRVVLDGPRPALPPVTDVTGKQLDIPDESLIIGKTGGIANVAIYLQAAPKDWIGTEPPREPVELRATDERFEPRMSFIRVGQRLRLTGSLDDDADNFRLSALRSVGFNVIIAGDNTQEIPPPFTKPEAMPRDVVSDIHPFKRAWLLALDHPFAAITDADGEFEIRDLPAGEHRFVVWHERRGYLEKNLIYRIERNRVRQISLKYKAAALEPIDTKPVDAPKRSD